jgi:hypothetical protein
MPAAICCSSASRSDERAPERGRDEPPLAAGRASSDDVVSGWARVSVLSVNEDPSFSRTEQVSVGVVERRVRPVTRRRRGETVVRPTRMRREQWQRPTETIDEDDEVHHLLLTVTRT